MAESDLGHGYLSANLVQLLLISSSKKNVKNHTLDLTGMHRL